MIYVWQKVNIVVCNGDIASIKNWLDRDRFDISENLARLNALLMVILIRTNWINVQEFVPASVLAGLRM